MGVILLGYFSGQLYDRKIDSNFRVNSLIKLGLGCIALLLALRGFNIYGETLPWEYGEHTIYTIMSFLISLNTLPTLLDFPIK